MYQEEQDLQTHAPFGSRVHGVCDVCSGGFILAFSAFLLCGFSLFARALSLESRGVPGQCFRRDVLREAAWKGGAERRNTVGSGVPTNWFEGWLRRRGAGGSWATHGTPWPRHSNVFRGESHDTQFNPSRRGLESDNAGRVLEWCLAYRKCSINVHVIKEVEKGYKASR